MFRRAEKKKNQHTTPDHRPQHPLLRFPEDPIDTAVRDLHTRYDRISPADKQNWR